MASDKPGHHILPEKMILIVGTALLILTAVTVWVAGFHFGSWNLFIAMLVATVKASLVVLFFMGLKYDVKENLVIFLTSLLFVAIFFVLTFSDVFFRREVVLDPKFAAAGQASKLEKPWESNPQLLESGKELYSAQCVSCHGTAGKGDGPAAAALNPKPRDFTAGSGWLKPRKVTKVFETLTKGIGSMPAFGSLPPDDRWALSHYVLSLGPKPSSVSSSDLKAIGVDPTKKGGGSSGEKTLPIEFAIDLMVE